MKTVRCLNDTFTETDNSSEAFKAILKVGEELPQKGKVYTVTKEYHRGNEVFYSLEGLDYSVYGIDLYFAGKRFETVEDKFVPNMIGLDGGLAEMKHYIFETEINFNN